MEQGWQERELGGGADSSGDKQLPAPIGTLDLSSDISTITSQKAPPPSAGRESDLTGIPCKSHSQDKGSRSDSCVGNTYNMQE